ncbi:DUF3859 domain-containing protein [Gymnodinialimonas sp. 2305UL16-5]|uniref:DUF3859 domain-containing protein n=1 Tax=Gymnodinialimonas mytili TaxID=3126503 RepID=UPI0030AE64D3
MRRVLVSLLAIIFALCSVAQPAQANPRTGEDIAELIYGIYCTREPERQDPAPDTASGFINIVPGLPDFAFQQKVVPAEIGIGFGVLVTARQGRILDPVTITVTHPPYPDSGITVESWVTDIDGMGPSLAGYSFDTPNELVTGAWTFEGHDAAGVELFHITFEVVDPAMMPQVIDTCFDAFLS